MLHTNEKTSKLEVIAVLRPQTGLQFARQAGFSILLHLKILTS